MPRLIAMILAKVAAMRRSGGVPKSTKGDSHE
jgi:hypothetical protein